MHLCDFPEAGKVDNEVLERMEEVRKIVSLALEKRMSAGIKVRQPLQKLRVKSLELRGKEEYISLIRDEVNVKEIIFDEKIEGEVELETEITEELQKEGNVREIIRAIQDLRKQANLSPADSTVIKIETDEAGKKFVESAKSEIQKPTNVSEIKFENNNGNELKIENYKLKIEIKQT